MLKAKIAELNKLYDDYLEKEVENVKKLKLDRVLKENLHKK